MPRVRLAKDLSRHVRLGHPWIYADALRRPRPALPAGAVADVVGARDELVARGFYDPEGPIAVRVLATADEGPVGPDLVAARIAGACALRAAARARIDSDAIRLLHGEGDRVPGLVLDLYGDTGVIRFDGTAAEAFWGPRVPLVVDACRAAGFPLARLWARPTTGRRGTGRPLLGGTPTEIVIHEGAARYAVDVVHGQKTGFFLDQRDNRRLVGRLAAGVTVLNLFAYTGGFSVAAALGGAHRVTSVDLASPAIEAARRNLQLNDVPSDDHELVVADAFAFLRDAAAAGRRWEVVVCDPPSFAPSARALEKARSAYRELNRAAADVVAPGGLLATASCSSHVDVPLFTALVAEGVARTGRTARVLDVRGAGVDHPVLPGFSEGRYLKMLLLHVA